MLILCILFFAALYAIKGGWLGKIPGFNGFMRSNKVLDFVLDGTRLSSLLAGLFAGQFMPAPQAALFGLAWFVGVMVSMGEEAGAIGRAGRSWGPYIEWLGGKGRAFGWKKGVQRFVFMGALLALATGYTGFIVAGAFVPVIYWLGSTLHYLIHRKDSWAYAEPAVGALFGLVFYLAQGAAP